MNAVEEIYWRIGKDMVEAALRNDRPTITALVELVVALEKAYPKKMEELRAST